MKPEFQAMDRFLQRDAWIFMAHGGEWQQADGTYRGAGRDFIRSAMTGWKQDFCHLSAFLKEPEIRHPNLCYNGMWQPRGRGKMQKEISVQDLEDIKDWFDSRSSYVGEVFDPQQVQIVKYSSIIKPYPSHPTYTTVQAGDDVQGRNSIDFDCFLSFFYGGK